MARLAGVDLPREKRVEIALTYVFGIGRTCPADPRDTGVNPDTRVRDLTEEDLVKIREYVDDNLKTEGDLRREVSGRHPPQGGDRLLPGSSSPPGPSGPRSAHPYERPHPKGSASRDRR